MEWCTNRAYILHVNTTPWHKCGNRPPEISKNTSEQIRYQRAWYLDVCNTLFTLAPQQMSHLRFVRFWSTADKAGFPWRLELLVLCSDFKQPGGSQKHAFVVNSIWCFTTCRLHIHKLGNMMPNWQVKKRALVSLIGGLTSLLTTGHISKHSRKIAPSYFGKTTRVTWKW